MYKFEKTFLVLITFFVIRLDWIQSYFRERAFFKYNKTVLLDSPAKIVFVIKKIIHIYSFSTHFTSTIFFQTLAREIIEISNLTTSFIFILFEKVGE